MKKISISFSEYMAIKTMQTKFDDDFNDCRCSEIPELEEKVKELKAENDKLCTQLDSESQISYLRQDEIEELRKALKEVESYLWKNLLEPNITETKRDARFIKSQAHFLRKKIQSLTGKEGNDNG